MRNNNIETKAEKIRSHITSTFKSLELTKAFKRVLSVLGQTLSCDRIFLYVRSPQHHIGRVSFCWRSRSDIPEIYNAQWIRESSELVKQDPLFAAALRAEPTRFIEDINTADPEVVNAHFEAQNFGHRALVHAHLQDAQLWGILQPCVFHQARHWSADDRAVIFQAIHCLTSPVMQYVDQSLNQGLFEVIHDH